MTKVKLYLSSIGPTVHRLSLGIIIQPLGKRQKNQSVAFLLLHLGKVTNWTQILLIYTCPKHHLSKVTILFKMGRNVGLIV